MDLADYVSRRRKENDFCNPKEQLHVMCWSFIKITGISALSCPLHPTVYSQFPMVIDIVWDCGSDLLNVFGKESIG